MDKYLNTGIKEQQLYLFTRRTSCETMRTTTSRSAHA
jgi:hypothetical protein